MTLLGLDRRAERSVAAKHKMVRPVPPPRTFHLPQAPSDEEKYSYFDVQRRWPFVLMFFSQISLIYAFVAVMLHTPDTALGLVFLTVMVPPVFVNLWLRLRRRRLDLEDHVVWVEEWRGFAQRVPQCRRVPARRAASTRACCDNTFEHVAGSTGTGRAARLRARRRRERATRARSREEFGFDYVVRPNRGEWKKAGNLIAGFDVTDGDFIAVFDADFVPRTDFLWETVPYMSQSNTGVVQTAQYFDVDARVNYFARYAGSLQELFFRWIQPARDTCEAAICAGTNVVYRRAAVVAAGGFAKVPLGEDVHSGVKIWVANYRTRYVPIVRGEGAGARQLERADQPAIPLVPQLDAADDEHVLPRRAVRPKQRVCFWAAFLYYMASAALPITSTLPTLIMVWVFPNTIHPGNYLPMIPGLICDALRLPARRARMAADDLSRLHRQQLLPPVRGLRCAAQPGAGVGSHRCSDVEPKTDSAAACRSGSPGSLRLWLLVTQALLWGGLLRHWCIGGRSILACCGRRSRSALVPTGTCSVRSPGGWGRTGDDFDEIDRSRVRRARAAADR